MKTPSSVILAPFVLDHDKLMMGSVASVISRHLPCNWMPVRFYFMKSSLNAIVSGSVL
jgi:hypothetical protein